MWMLGLECRLRMIRSYVCEGRAHVVLLHFHLFDCCAGLHNLDAMLGPTRLFVGLGRKHDPSHGICSGQQCFRTKGGLDRSRTHCMSLQIRQKPENKKN